MNTLFLNVRSFTSVTQLPQQYHEHILRKDITNVFTVSKENYSHL